MYFKCACDEGTGTPGTPGVDGLSVLSGHGVPTTVGRPGEFYIDLDTYIMYGPKGSDANPWSNFWSILGVDGINGSDGINGINGVDGINGVEDRKSVV